MEKAVSYGKRFDFCTHEAMERIFGCTDNGFTTHIEAGVDDDRTSGAIGKNG
jgi:hypothetical protein